MNTQNKIQSIADPGSITYTQSGRNPDVILVRFSVKGVWIGGQFDIDNSGVYGLSIGSIDDLITIIKGGEK